MGEGPNMSRLFGIESGYCHEFILVWGGGRHVPVRGGCTYLES